MIRNSTDAFSRLATAISLLFDFSGFRMVSHSAYAEDVPPNYNFVL